MKLKVFESEEFREKGLSFNAPNLGDGGFDLPTLEKVIIEPGKIVKIRTGLHFAIQIGFVGLVRDRSSVGKKGGLSLAGVIDASYRGEVMVLMTNQGSKNIEFEIGDRIAQLVVVPHLNDLIKVSSAEGLGSTERGSGSFGSTGR